jgi:serine/threonine-protein kinase
MPEIAPDTLVDGRYKILTRIGSGGMADVFCAEDQQLGRKVALKLLHRRFAEDAEFVERFRREASAAAGLTHPNVVGVYDRGEWDGTYYIAMEYLPGRTLKDVIVGEAPLDPVRAIDLTVQILKAARFAHRRGIVHRDLKPHNVLVDDEDRVKVTDFGIARAGASDMTETGSIMGTAQYLSPEQAQGHAVSPASDLYSVGVILFELLTAYVPFDADSAVSIALKHVSEPPPAPSTFDPSVPPELESIVLWALEKDAARRPADADAFIAALEAARDDVLAGEAPGQRTAAFVPPAAPITPAYQAPPPPPPPRLVPEEPRNRPPWWAWLLGLLALAAIVAGLLLLTGSQSKPVPRVVGQDLQTATAELRDAGFEARVTRVTSAKPLDQVLEQDPGGGASADEGSTVRLTVSGGPGTTEVPVLEGLGQRKALARLDDAGLDADVQEQSDPDVRKGRVISSTPGAGTTVDRGSTVTLVVSSGPEQVAVPDVTTLSEEDAKQALALQGLQWEVVAEPSMDADPGTVVRQSPEADTQVDRGSTVQLFVAQEIPAVPVPDVRFATLDDAAQAIVDAGLEPRETVQDVSDPSQDGIVIDQRPAPGTSVPSGAPVRLYVGRYVDPSAEDGQ